MSKNINFYMWPKAHILTSTATYITLPIVFDNPGILISSDDLCKVSTCIGEASEVTSPALPLAKTGRQPTSCQ